MTWSRSRPRVWQRVVALAACWLLVGSAALPIFAAPAPSVGDTITLTADRVEYQSQARRVRADGHVRVTDGASVMTADHVEADLEAEEVVARGNVTFAQGDKTLTGSLIRYNFRTRTGRVEKAVGELAPWHVSAESIDVAPSQDVATEASITSCDPDRPVYRVTAKKIVIVPGESFTAYDASLWVAGVHIISLPSYTASLRGRSGPSVGYNSLDGAYVEYANSFALGSWRDEYRIRLATTTLLTAENVVSQRFGDHVWSVDLGRSQVLNSSNNLVNLDRFSLDLTYDKQRIPEWPVSFQIEGHAGSYAELGTGVTTTRADAVLSLASDTFVLSPTLYFSASARIHYDVYGTGQQRTVVEGSAALTSVLSPLDSTALSYALVDVTGSTPFSFDSYSPTSSATLGYNHIFGGFVQSAGASLTYGFLAMQTTLGLNASFSIDPNTVFNIAVQYNLSTQQVTEVDYALNIRCDCVTVGLVYQTFPQSPASNTLMVTVQLNVFSGSGTARF